MLLPAAVPPPPAATIFYYLLPAADLSTVICCHVEAPTVRLRRYLKATVEGGSLTSADPYIGSACLKWHQDIIDTIDATIKMGLACAKLRTKGSIDVRRPVFWQVCR